jgi:hypothetical protein
MLRVVFARPNPGSVAIAVFLAAVATATPARSQDSALRAERTVSYAAGKSTPLTAKVGPVNVQSVEFSDRGRGGGSRLPGLRNLMSDTTTILRARFIAENPTADEWEVTFTVEFRDKSGKVIDRGVGKSSWEGESKPYDFDHPILAYVVPLIADVKITLEGKLD